jgi:hypothetical protein
MIKSKRWKHLVPLETFNVIRDIDGAKRIKEFKK